MVTYALILFFHVGQMATNDSNSTTSVQGFANEAECVAAGNKARQLVAGTVKEMRFVCVKQTGGVK